MTPIRTPSGSSRRRSERDLSVGGAELAAHTIRAGLVDEIQLLVNPIVIGAGKPALPPARVSLELRDERRFGNGVVYLRYRIVVP